MSIEEFSDFSSSVDFLAAKNAESRGEGSSNRQISVRCLHKNLIHFNLASLV